jgi:hypothetical protein
MPTERNHLIRRALIAAVVLALAASACARQGSAGAGQQGIRHATGPSDLVLQVWTGGGFVAPDYALGQPPGWSLFGNGDLITTGAQIEIYPGPAVPSLLVTHLSEDGVQAILEAARDAGLFGPDRSYATASVADAPTTTFTLTVDGRTHTVSVYALGEATDGRGMTDGEKAAREALRAFDAKLSDLTSWLPQGSIGEGRSFQPAALRVFVHPAEPQGGGELQEPLLDWPLTPGLALWGQPLDGPGPLRRNVRCGVAQGNDLTVLLPFAQRANTLSRWRSVGRLFSLTFRPLLPDESGCPESNMLGPLVAPSR